MTWRLRIAWRRIAQSLATAWRWADIGVQEALLLAALVLLAGGVGVCLWGFGADGRVAVGAAAMVGGVMLAVLAWPTRAAPDEPKRRTT